MPFLSWVDLRKKEVTPLARLARTPVSLLILAACLILGGCKSRAFWQPQNLVKAAGIEKASQLRVSFLSGDTTETNELGDLLRSLGKATRKDRELFPTRMRDFAAYIQVERRNVTLWGKYSADKKDVFLAFEREGKLSYWIIPLSAVSDYLKPPLPDGFTFAGTESIQKDLLPLLDKKGPSAVFYTFSFQCFLAIGTGEMPNNGYKIRILTAGIENNLLRVQAEVVKPSSGASQVASYPYTVISVPPGANAAKVTLDGREIKVTIYNGRAVIYFPDRKKGQLIPQTRFIFASQREGLPEAALRELMRGLPPDDPHYSPAFPSGSRILSLKEVDNPPGLTAVLDMSSEFKTNHWQDALNEQLTLDAIANTLIGMDFISRVQILIDGQKVETLAGHVRIREPISRNTPLVLPPIAPREVLRIPWGTTPEAVSYRTVQADGWKGPSTIAVAGGLVYVVDRVNCEIKVYGQDNKLVSVIALPSEYALHPDQLEVVGKSLYLTHYDIGQSMGLAIFRNGQWNDIDLEKSLPGFRGWLHLSSTIPGRLAIRRDVPPEEDKGEVARWAVLDESGGLVSSTVPMVASPHETSLEPQLITNEHGRQSIAPAGQEIALVNRAGNIVKRAPLESGTATIVITMLKDRTQDVFVRTRPLADKLDKWTTYLTVFGRNLEQRARVALVLPEKYRDSFVYPGSDIGRTEIVANDTYYELVYLKEGIVVLQWDPLAGE